MPKGHLQVEVDLTAVVVENSEAEEACLADHRRLAEEEAVVCEWIKTQIRTEY